MAKSFDPRKLRVRHPSLETPLRKIRRTRSLTQRQMAVVLDVCQQTYSKYEQGTVRPDLPRRERIATILGVLAHDLWPSRRTARATVAPRGKPLEATG